MPRKLNSTLSDGQLEELAAMGLSDEEFSTLLGRSESWTKANCSSPIKRGRARLRQSLRRAQIKSALSGNPTMLIWLGKQYLGQRDRGSLDVSAEQHRPLTLTPTTLHRLQASYRVTMERLRGALPGPGSEARGPLGDRVGVFETEALSNSGQSEFQCEL
jgi:hypothetical protein